MWIAGGEVRCRWLRMCRRLPIRKFATGLGHSIERYDGSRAVGRG